MPKLIAQGAEAKILLNKNQIIKDRISKPYRLSELDNKIRKSRTKKEAKLMIKSSKIINVPLPLLPKDQTKLIMPFIHGKKLSENLDSFSLPKQKSIMKQVGKDIAKLHDAKIIHGDLTTSNMILVDGKINDEKLISKRECDDKLTNSLGRVARRMVVGINKDKPIIFFVDFGLGFISHKFEDKAVDLHLLRQALEAKHYKHWETLWKQVELGYKTSKQSKLVLERLKAVEKRGRYKK